MNPPVPPPLIEGRALTVQIGGKTLLDHIDIAVRRDEIVTLIGPNGAGKTTLIRTLLGIMPAASGSVTRQRGLRVGYVPQRLEADPTMPLTVARFLRLGPRAGRAKIAEALAEVGIAELVDAPLTTLSGGEFRRAILARALLSEPDLLILDEPLQGVDFTGQLDLYDLVKRVRDRYRCGVLMVSHDLHVVMAATDRVVCINRHLCCAGEPEAVSQHPDYVALFGHRARELAVYAHHHDHAHDVAGNVVTLDVEAKGDGAKGDEATGEGAKDAALKRSDA